MALSIKSDKADRLARELATVTGESLTDAVTMAIEDRLARERRATRDVAGRLRRVR
ncbi:type II toxin-antitoxin system VapB family antitoxin, partial [Ilumatobacter sp.]|uniref:type II toxin-antitoxin system VapB family antitoxin n=1 Tax=Ilumatobacter sp. TaxID=1967498 RepID=UPI0037525AEF